MARAPRWMVVVLVVPLVGRASSTTTSSRSLMRWLLEHAPGPYANDVRVLNSVVAWEALELVSSYSPLIVSASKVRLLSEPGVEEHCVLEIDRLECTVLSVLWREARLVLGLRLCNPSLSLKAFDVALRDTNAQRLVAYLRDHLACCAGGNNEGSALGIASLDFEGGASIAVAPGDALGGDELKVELHLDLAKDLEPLSREIAARGAYLTPSQLASLLAAAVRARLAKAIVDKALQRENQDNTQGTTASLGSNNRDDDDDDDAVNSSSETSLFGGRRATLGRTELTSAGDVRRAVETALVSRVTGILATAKRKFLGLGPNDTTTSDGAAARGERTNSSTRTASPSATLISDFLTQLLHDAGRPPPEGSSTATSTTNATNSSKNSNLHIPSVAPSSRGGQAASKPG